MKVYLVVENCTDWPIEIKVFSTRKAAERALLAKIGAEIQCYLMEGDKEGAINFIKNLSIGDSDNWYFSDEHGEIYIEEKEMEGD